MVFVYTTALYLFIIAITEGPVSVTALIGTNAQFESIVLVLVTTWCGKWMDYKLIILTY